MGNSNVPGSNQNVNVQVRALTLDPNVTVQYKTKILQKNLVNGVNTLTQAMMNQTNTKYVIKYDYTLGENITVPANCVLEFDGGSISTGSGENMDTITGNNTGIQANLIKIFNTNITLTGTWNVPENYPEWFGAKGDGITDDTNTIQAALNFATNSVGRTCKLQAKSYLIIENISIPTSITLCGVYSRNAYSYNKMTVLYLKYRNTVDIGYVYISYGCKLTNIAFYEYDQDRDNIKQYAPVITTDTAHNSSSNGVFGYAMIEHITFVNVYSGISFPNNTYNLNIIIRDVVGCILHDGITILRSVDTCRIEDIHFNNNFDNYSGDSSKTQYQNYASNNAIGFHFKGCDGLFMTGCLVYGLYKGAIFEGLSSGQGHMNNITNCGFDACVYCCIENDAGDLTIDNCWLTCFKPFSGTEITPYAAILDNASAVVNNCSIFSIYKYCIYGKNTNIRSCSFSPSDKLQEPAPNPIIYLTGNSCSIIDSIFKLSTMAAGKWTIQYIGAGNCIISGNKFINHPNPSNGYIYSSGGGSLIGDNNISSYTTGQGQQNIINGTALIYNNYGLQRIGNSTSRPDNKKVYVGFRYFDTTLGKPIYVKEISNSTVTWVDATGATV